MRKADSEVASGSVRGGGDTPFGQLPQGHRFSSLGISYGQTGARPVMRLPENECSDNPEPTELVNGVGAR